MKKKIRLAGAFSSGVGVAKSYSAMANDKKLQDYFRDDFPKKGSIKQQAKFMRNMIKDKAGISNIPKAVRTRFSATLPKAVILDKIGFLAERIRSLEDWRFEMVAKETAPLTHPVIDNPELQAFKDTVAPLPNAKDVLDQQMTATMETQLLFGMILPKLKVEEQVYVLKLAVKQNPWILRRQECVAWLLKHQDILLS